jgi:hypothetical protein
MHLEDVSLVPAFQAYTASVLDPKVDGVLDPKTDSVIDPKVDSVIDPKIDGAVPLPIITTASHLQVFGVVHLRRGVRKPGTVGLIGDVPTIQGRVTLQFADGRSRWFDITLVTIGEKDMPTRFGFSGVISPALIGDTPTHSSATLTLACVNCPRGTVINAGVYVEEISVIGHPSFAPYVVGLTPSAPDPIPR